MKVEPNIIQKQNKERIELNWIKFELMESA